MEGPSKQMLNSHLDSLHLRRYPFHFHLMGTVADSFFEDCTVQHSFFRAYTVHGTSSSRVSRNVAYDISGSAYYLEDGVEEHQSLQEMLHNTCIIHVCKC